MEKSWRQDLERLVISITARDNGQMKALVQDAPHGVDLLAEVNFDKPAKRIAENMVMALEQHGLLGAWFFERMVNNWPKREAEIRRVQGQHKPIVLVLIQGDESTAAAKESVANLFDELATDENNSRCHVVVKLTGPLSNARFFKLALRDQLRTVQPAFLHYIGDWSTQVEGAPPRTTLTQGDWAGVLGQTRMKWLEGLLVSSRNARTAASGARQVGFKPVISLELPVDADLSRGFLLAFYEWLLTPNVTLSQLQAEFTTWKKRAGAENDERIQLNPSPPPVPPPPPLPPPPPIDDELSSGHDSHGQSPLGTTAILHAGFPVPRIVLAVVAVLATLVLIAGVISYLQPILR